MGKKLKISTIDKEAQIINSKNVPPLERVVPQSTIEDRQIIEHLQTKELLSLKLNKFLGNSTNILLKLENDFGAADKDSLFKIIDEQGKYAEVDKLMCISAEEAASAMVREMVSYVESLQNKHDFSHMVDWLKIILKFEFDGRKTFIQRTLNFAVTSDVTQSEAVLEYTLTWVSDVDKDMYKYFLRQFAYKALKSAKYELASKYFDKGLSFDKYDQFALWGMIYASIQSSSQELIPCMENFTEYQTVENLICSCATPQEKKEVYEKLVLSAIKYVEKTDGLTGKNNVFKAFERFISYIPVNMDSFLRTVMVKMGDLCRAKKIFGPAIKYYSWAIRLREESELYWKLLQVKILCSSDEEMINQSIPLAKLPEYEQAMTRADSSLKSRYKELEEKQKTNAKTKAKENKKRNTISVTKKVVISVVTIGVVALASILGGVFGYRATTKLKYVADGNFNGYSVYHAKNFSESEVIIPTEYNNSPVTSIEDNAFAGDSTIETLVLPNTMINIGKGAFKGCVNLKSVVIRDTSGDKIAYADSEAEGALLYIEESAFEGCTSLEDFVIPEGVKTIGSRAFAGTALDSVSLPSTLTEIGDEVFDDCTKLESIDMVGRTLYPIEWGDIWLSRDKEQQDKVTINCNIRVYLNLNYPGAGAAMQSDILYKTIKELYKPTRVGYTFDGWYSNADCTGTKYTGADGLLTEPWEKDGSTNLYAKWIAEDRTVRFDANGGTGTMEDIIGKTGSTITLTANTFTNEGKTFLGWGTSSTQTNKLIADGAEYTINYKSINYLYAIWG